MKILNYEDIVNVLENFFKTLNYKHLPITKLITNKKFNKGLAYTENEYFYSNSFQIVKCSRIEDITKVINFKSGNNNICVLPLFHYFSTNLSLELLTVFLNFIIKNFNLDVSKINLETTCILKKVINILQKKCNINNIDYKNDNLSKILCDGTGYIIGPYGSPNSKIYPAISINYILDANNIIEIIQLVEFENNKFGIGIGIERLYTSIHYKLCNVFIPNWYNTLPIFKLTCDNEVKENGLDYPDGYHLILNTDPKDIPRDSRVYDTY
jgi:hypothetical protein